MGQKNNWQIMNNQKFILSLITLLASIASNYLIFNINTVVTQIFSRTFYKI